jgi:hypothetical protein
MKELPAICRGFERLRTLLVAQGISRVYLQQDLREAMPDGGPILCSPRNAVATYYSPDVSRNHVAHRGAPAPGGALVLDPRGTA